MKSRQAKASRGWRCPYCGRWKPVSLKVAHLLAEDAIREWEAGLAAAEAHPVYAPAEARLRAKAYRAIENAAPRRKP